MSNSYKILDHDVIDHRIDVAAQRAILRMRSRAPVCAYELLYWVKSNQLRGFVGDDLKMAADHAKELGTVRWELVPRGQDAKVVPGAGGSLPLAVYKAGARKSRSRMDAAANLVHKQAAKIVKKGSTPWMKKKQVLIYATNDSWNVRWAKQFLKKDPSSRVIIPMPAFVTKAQVVQIVKKAASQAGNDGEVIFSVGHGGITTQITAAFVDIAPVLKQGKRKIPKWRLVRDFRKEVFYDRKQDKYTMSQEKLDEDMIRRGEAPGATLQDRRMAVGARRRKELRRKYMEIGKAFQKNKVLTVVFLTCKVGKETDFIDKIGKDWEVDVIAPLKKIAIWEDKQKKIRLYFEGDPVGHGSNTVRARTEYPEFNLDDYYHTIGRR